MHKSKLTYNYIGNYMKYTKQQYVKYSDNIDEQLSKHIKDKI